jgi:hypothetical protein
VVLINANESSLLTPTGSVPEILWPIVIVHYSDSLAHAGGSWSLKRVLNLNLSEQSKCLAKAVLSGAYSPEISFPSNTHWYWKGCQWWCRTPAPHLRALRKSIINLERLTIEMSIVEYSICLSSQQLCQLPQGCFYLLPQVSNIFQELPAAFYATGISSQLHGILHLWVCPYYLLTLNYLHPLEVEQSGKAWSFAWTWSE